MYLAAIQRWHKQPDRDVSKNNWVTGFSEGFGNECLTFWLPNLKNFWKYSYGIKGQLVKTFGGSLVLCFV